jgi:DNA-binding NtrC family response regulator
VWEAFLVADNSSTETGDVSLGHLRPARVFRVSLVASPARTPSVAITLDARPLVLGRDPTGERLLTLADEQTSRNHAEIAHDAAADAYAIRDLGSRNGVFVNGQRVQASVLEPGAVIRLGRSLLVCSSALVASSDPLEPEWPTLRGIGLAMQRVRGEIARVAPRRTPVLILGETGTGKELVARDLHRLSGRGGAFVAVNCAAIPEAIAESELFGHAAGAFTGATTKTEGFFAAADRGTLFLDEVAELPAAVQAKLLRALATGEVRPLGRTESRTVDVRVVAATHGDVAARTTFRPDLLARLAGWTIHLPPLRERREDILDLARLFLERDAASASLAPAAAEALLRYGWPLNVRELESTMSAASIRAGSGGVVRLEDLPDAVASPMIASSDAPRAEPPLAVLVPRDQVPSASDLRLVMKRFDGNVARVAEYFGKDRKQVYRWLERAGTEPPSE